nr:hypothetical protein [Devosia lucknowensis]
MSEPLHIGIDLGMGIARAGIFYGAGRMLAMVRHDIAIFREARDVVQQLSPDIWAAVTASVRNAQDSGVNRDAIAGMFSTRLVRMWSWLLKARCCRWDPPAIRTEMS